MKCLPATVHRLPRETAVLATIRPRPGNWSSLCVPQDTYDGLAPETNYEVMAGRSAENKAIRSIIDLEGKFLPCLSVESC